MSKLEEVLLKASDLISENRAGLNEITRRVNEIIEYNQLLEERIEKLEIIEKRYNNLVKSKIIV